MSFANLVSAATVYFPSLQIKYKDQSTLMKVLGKLSFFNPEFMTMYITTIGNTVYFPSATFITLHPVSSYISLCHELVHMSDEKKYSKFLFGLSYVFPQILAPFTLLLAFAIGWWTVIPFLLFLAPWPAPFRTIWEKRAYIAALYVQYTLSKKQSFNPHLSEQVADDVAEFKTADYYYMAPFGSGVQNDFNDALTLINDGKRPYNDAVFDMLDDVMSKS